MKKSSGDDSSPVKCCTGILRRLLVCSGGSLPTHPSDQFLDTELIHIQKPAQLEPDTYTVLTSPGVVARLMGLETMPKATSATLGSLLRSRSVNSIDFLSHFDLNKQGQLHRRVRTSISFREGGGMDCDCILQELHNRKGEKDRRLRSKEAEIIVQDKQKPLEMEGERRPATCQRSRTRPKVNKDSVVMGSKKRKAVWARKVQLPNHPEHSLPGKPLLPEVGAHAIIKDNNEEKMRIYSNPRVEVEGTWRMTGKDVKDNGVVFFRSEDSEEICQQFGQEILHVLLRQLVDELVLLQGTLD